MRHITIGAESIDIECLPIIVCPKCGRTGRVMQDKSSRTLIIHAYHADTGEVTRFCEVGEPNQ